MEGQCTDHSLHDLIEAIPTSLLPLATTSQPIFTMSAPPAGMAPVKIPANLPDLVRTAFNRARASGDVHFFPTQVALVNVNSIPVRPPSPSILNHGS
jgi:hypothetical protein